MIKEIKKYLKKTLQQVECIENINLDLTQHQKKCLISYIVSNFKYDLDKNIVPATNILEVNQIVKTFINFNYCIDIVFCMDLNAFEKIQSKQYDVIFGFGAVFNRMSKLNPDKKRILYMTEHHPTFSKNRESERVAYFYERHGKKVPLSRSGFYYQEDNLNYINDIIVLGETFPFDSEKYNIHTLNPTGLFNERYKFRNRNIDQTKYNFLWFGSNGAIHKGLDLLIEIFSKRNDINLHICGLSKKDRKILKIPNRKNIFDYGWINVQEDAFLDIVDRCSYIILPSCSEAMSTSVLTCMRHSMIPIVMKDAGFNKIADLVISLDDFSLEYIDKAITLILKNDDSFVERMHKDIYKYSNEEFILEKFSSDFNAIIKKIIN